MTDRPPSRPPGKDSWDCFKPVGDERNRERKDSLLGWICLVVLLAAVTLAIVPLLLVGCLGVATGGRLLVVNPTARVGQGNLSAFGDRQSLQIFGYALGVWWLSGYLAQPIRAEHGANAALLARFAMGCAAHAPVVWFMKRQLERSERAKQAERQAREEAKRRRAEAVSRRESETE